MTAIERIRKSRFKSLNAHDYLTYTPDIDHTNGSCRCCTPIYPKTEKRQYRKKKAEAA